MAAVVDAPDGAGGAGGAGGRFADPRPGPELTAALLGDPALLVGREVEAGLVGAFRAANHAAWARCRWLLEACCARAGRTARVGLEARAALIAAAALHWSPSMA
ncbi:MAG TPA: hypothetical protein VGH76_01300, partial [Actinomycetospora sp.]|uniref:hypothetical protein n=1 Tax=Actinomycetospora sp. TaxID=1872135 RepID=UPI002F42C177